MLYRVRLYDPSNAAVREESAHAVSHEALMQRYASLGLLVLSARGPTWLARIRTSHRGSSGLDVAWWCRELKTLLHAGMTVVEAIETLSAQSAGGASSSREAVHTGLMKSLGEGKALSAAMQEVGGFPDILIVGVQASERTSNLVEALDDYLLHHEMLDRLRKQVLSASIYPAVVVCLGSVITLFLLLFVVPRFSQMYGSLHGSAGFVTKALLVMSSALEAHLPVVVMALVALVGVVVLAWRLGAIAHGAAALVQGIPWLRSQLDQFRLAKLYHSMALMFRGGYSLDDALDRCAGLGLGEELRQRVSHARAGLLRGQRVSVAFGDAGLTDIVTLRLLAVGERSGNFDQILQTIALRHAQTFSTFIERATRFVEPLLLLLVALLVGGIVVMMYMPIFDIATSVR